MPKNKKKFIDPKSAVTFNLVHRSQRDPLVTDEKAPQHVLKEIEPKTKKAEKKEELIKYGIYFDDDYDYMQHLKPIEQKGEMIVADNIINTERGTTALEFPSSVFQSCVLEKVGVLNKAAPKSGLDLDLDPDIVAAMDEDFDYSDPENMLEDNFIELAKGHDTNSDDSEDTEKEVEDIYGSNEDISESDDDEVNSIDMIETKSRFTEYSMTSSVIRRNKHLTLLDDEFEEMFADYDDSEVGPLDTEEIEGVMDPKSEILVKYADEFESERKSIPLILEPTELLSESETSSEECSYIEVKEKPPWDCESILSTYSTIYNHPKVIEAPQPKIKINSKTGIPETKVRLTAKALATLNNDNTIKTGPLSLVSQVSTLSTRPKGENQEERKRRKNAFREYKRERRVERKLNSNAFKEEKKKMEKMMANNKDKFLHL